MLEAIRNFFDRRIGAGAPERVPSIQRATAALLAEVVRIDREISPQAQAVAQRAIREKFGLSEAEATEILALADEEVRAATDYYQFTSLINRDFAPEQKIRMIELLWMVAYADEELSAHEIHLVRKMAGLLHVPPSVYIAAKMRAQEAMRGDG